MNYSKTNRGQEIISSGIATSVSAYVPTSEDDGYISNASQSAMFSGDTSAAKKSISRHLLRYDDNISRIVSLGFEDKLMKTQFQRVDLTDALVKVTQNLDRFTVKQSGNFLYAISKLLHLGFSNLNSDLKDFFTRFKDHFVKTQQQQQQEQQHSQHYYHSQQNRSKRRSSNPKKRFRNATREFLDGLSNGGDDSNSIDERSNISIQMPRHLSSEEKLNLYQQNLISPIFLSDGVRNNNNNNEEIFSSSENSNRFDDLNHNSINKRRLDLLGEDEGSVMDGGENNNAPNTAVIDYDAFQYDFSEKDSLAGENAFETEEDQQFNFGEELEKMGEFSDRIIRKVSVNYAGQQSSKKKRKYKPRQPKSEYIGSRTGLADESFDYDVEVLARQMESKLDEFFAEAKADAGDSSSAFYHATGASSSVDQTAMHTILATTTTMGLTNTIDGDVASYLNASVSILGLNHSTAAAVSRINDSFLRTNFLNSFHDDHHHPTAGTATAASGIINASNKILDEELLSKLERTVRQVTPVKSAIKRNNQSLDRSRRNDELMNSIDYGDNDILRELTKQEADELDFRQQQEQIECEIEGEQQDQCGGNGSFLLATPGVNRNLKSEFKSEDKLKKEQQELAAKSLTEEEKKKVTEYAQLLGKLAEIIPKERSASFGEIFATFRGTQKHPAELFYDFLELQKLGKISIIQSNKLVYASVYISIVQ